MSNGKTFEQCMEWLRKSFSFTHADHLTKRLMGFNPNLFSQVNLLPALRSQPCAICRIDMAGLDWAYIGHGGQVLQTNMGCAQEVLVALLDGGYVLVSHQQMHAINAKLKDRLGRICVKEIDYDQEARAVSVHRAAA